MQKQKYYLIFSDFIPFAWNLADRLIYLCFSATVKWIKWFLYASQTHYEDKYIMIAI